MALIAVYGSLRVGEYNHDRFKSSCLGPAVIEGYNLYDLGVYPAAYPGEGKIVVDVLFVSDDVKRQIDRMEFGAGYVETTVPTPYGDASLYLYGTLPKYRKVSGGDWSAYQNKEDLWTQC